MSVANESYAGPEYPKRNLPFYRHDDRLHHGDDRLRCHDDRLRGTWSRQFTTMATVFVVKNRALHGEKPFILYEVLEFTAICKECALLLTKQYYTITSYFFTV